MIDSSDSNLMNSGATIQLAEFCSTLDVNDLDDDVRKAVSLSLLDTVAACYAGVKSVEGDRMMSYVDAYAGLGDSSVVGANIRTLPEFAALANGTTAHTLELDDGHRGASAHPGSPVVPAVLAMAAETDSSGADLLTAITVGYEAMLKVAMTVQPSHRRQHFHATATTGCFGAAAAVASLLNLNMEKTADALGLAGTQAGGLFEFLTKGSMAKRFHPGRAAMAGVVAARLADAGFDGPDTIVEGPDGFIQAFADEFDLTPLDHLGDPFEVTRRYVKPYPCCRHLHGSIDAAKTLLDQGLDLDDVTDIRVETYHNAAYHNKTAVETFLDAQMSIPYALAITFDSGDARMDQFKPPRMDDKRIVELMENTLVIETEAMESRYPKTRPATLIVETRSDNTYEELVDYPLGAPENPLSREVFEMKFRNLTHDALSDEDRDWLIDAGYSLTTFDDALAFVERL